MLFYKHEQHIVPDNCTKYEQNHHILLQDNTTNTQLKIDEKITIITQIWQSKILFYMNQRPLVPDHGIQYEENPASQHGGMHMDGLTDRRTLSYIPRFCLDGAGNNNNERRCDHRQYMYMYNGSDCCRYNTSLVHYNFCLYYLHIQFWSNTTQNQKVHW